MQQLDAAARVGRAVAEHSRAHAVRNARLELAEPGVLAGSPVSLKQGNVLVAKRHPRSEQLRQIRRIVLPIAIERANPFRARLTHARGHGGTLPAPKRMPQQPDLRNRRTRGEHDLGGLVRAAIVHEQNLELAPGQRRGDFLGERPDVFLLVAHRNHNRDFGSAHDACRPSAARAM